MNKNGKQWLGELSIQSKKLPWIASILLWGTLLSSSLQSVADIRVVRSNESEPYQLEFTTAPDSYYIIETGTELGMLQQAQALIDGRTTTDAQATFSFLPSLGQAFYTIRRFSISQPADYDRDGMDDLFEHNVAFLDPFNSQDGEADYDADGLSNAEEYARGADIATRDVYPLVSESDALIVGPVGTSAQIEVGLTQWGLDKPNVTFHVTKSETSQNTPPTSLTPIRSDENGRLTLPVVIEPGTTKYVIGGQFAANELEFFIASTRLSPLSKLSTQYDAGTETTLSVHLEGWTDSGIEQDLQLQLSAQTEDGLLQSTIGVDDQGTAEFPFSVPAGTSIAQISSPQLAGQRLTFRIEGVTQSADAIHLTAPFDSTAPWLEYGQSATFEVEAIGPQGQPLAGVPLNWAATKGSAHIEQTKPFTDSNGRMRVEVTPESTGLIQLEVRNGASVVESEFAVTPVTYENELRSVFQKCADCHHADFSLPLLTYEQIRYGIGPRSGKPIVDPRDPDNSPLVFLTQPEDGEMFLNSQCCSSTSPLTIEEALLIREWVRSGAQEAFLRPGTPEALVVTSGMDQIGVPGTELPRPLRFTVVDSLGIAVPLTTVRVTSSGNGDKLGQEEWKSNYAGEIEVPLRLAMEPGNRDLTLEVDHPKLVQRFELKINDAYHGGELAASPHSLDQALTQVLKPSNLEPAPRSTQGEFLMRVVEHTTGRHPDTDDPELGFAIQEFLGDADSAGSRRRLIDHLVDSEAFLKHWVSDRISSWIEVPEKADIRDGEPRFDVPAIDLLTKNDSLTRFVQTIGTLGGRGNAWKNEGYHEAGYAISSTHDVMEGGKNSFEQVMSAFAATSIGCARCHDHKLTGNRDNPRWTQEQAYGMYAFFAESPEALEMPQLDGSLKPAGLDYPVWWLDGVDNAQVSTNPVQDVWAGPVKTLINRRTEFWNRLTASPVFSRAVAHRIWTELFSPLLDPRDIRAETMEPLRQTGMIKVLNQLQSAFEQNETRLREFVRYCLYSEAYQLSSRTHERYDESADALMGRFPVSRRFAETLNHGFHLVGGVDFESHHYLPLNILGYPQRRVVPFWDHRRHTAGVTEALMMLNSWASPGRLAESGDSTFSQDYTPLLQQPIPGEQRQAFTTLATELVFKALLRPPTEIERQYLESLPPTLTSLRDLAAGLGTSSEYVFR